MGEFLRNVARAAIPLALTMCGGSVVAPNEDAPDADDTCASCTSRDAGPVRDATVSDATVFDASPIDSSTGDSAVEDSGPILFDGGPEPDDAGPPLLPSDVPGLVLWLEGDVGIEADPRVAGAIGKWDDQSGNGNDAVDSQDPVATGYPSLHAGGRNGHDTLVCGFNGSALYVPHAASLHFGTSDFLVIVVMTADLNGSLVWGKSATSDTRFALYLLPSPSPHYAFTDGSENVSLPASGGGAFHVITMRGKATDLRVDSVSAPGATNALDLTDDNYGIDLCQGASFANEIAEVVAVKGTVSIEDTRRVEKYLRIKYDL